MFKQVPAVDFITLGASRVGRQVRGSHDLDGSKKEKERSMSSSHKKLKLDVFLVEAG